jgi:hypothetical protein
MMVDIDIIYLQFIAGLEEEDYGFDVNESRRSLQP